MQSARSIGSDSLPSGSNSLSPELNRGSDTCAKLDNTSAPTAKQWEVLLKEEMQSFTYNSSDRDESESRLFRTYSGLGSDVSGFLKEIMQSGTDNGLYSDESESMAYQADSERNSDTSVMSFKDLAPIAKQCEGFMKEMMQSGTDNIIDSYEKEYVVSYSDSEPDSGASSMPFNDIASVAKQCEGFLKEMMQSGTDNVLDSDEKEYMVSFSDSEPDSDASSMPLNDIASIAKQCEGFLKKILETSTDTDDSDENTSMVVQSDSEQEDYASAMPCNDLAPIAKQCEVFLRELMQSSTDAGSDSYAKLSEENQPDSLVKECETFLREIIQISTNAGSDTDAKLSENGQPDSIAKQCEVFLNKTLETSKDNDDSDKSTPMVVQSDPEQEDYTSAMPFNELTPIAKQCEGFLKDVLQSGTDNGLDSDENEYMVSYLDSESDSDASSMDMCSDSTKGTSKAVKIDSENNSDISIFAFNSAVSIAKQCGELLNELIQISIDNDSESDESVSMAIQSDSVFKRYERLLKDIMQTNRDNGSVVDESRSTDVQLDLDSGSVAQALPFNCPVAKIKRSEKLLKEVMQNSGDNGSSSDQTESVAAEPHSEGDCEISGIAFNSFVPLTKQCENHLKKIMQSSRDNGSDCAAIRSNVIQPDLEVSNGTCVLPYSVSVPIDKQREKL